MRIRKRVNKCATLIITFSFFYKKPKKTDRFNQEIKSPQPLAQTFCSERYLVF